jgi:hypothetical protein
VNLEDVLPLWIVVHVCAAGYCAIVGRQKGRSAAGWGFAGLVFSLFAILAVHARSPADAPPAGDEPPTPEASGTAPSEPAVEAAAPAAPATSAGPPRLDTVAEIDRLRAQAEELRQQIAAQRELQRAREEVAGLRSTLRDLRAETALVAEEPFAVPHEPSAAQRELLRWGAEHGWPAVEGPGLPHLPAGQACWMELAEQCHPDILVRILGDLARRGEDSPTDGQPSRPRS